MSNQYRLAAPGVAPLLIAVFGLLDLRAGDVRQFPGGRYISISRVWNVLGDRPDRIQSNFCGDRIPVEQLRSADFTHIILEMIARSAGFVYLWTRVFFVPMLPQAQDSPQSARDKIPIERSANLSVARRLDLEALLPPAECR